MKWIAAVIVTALFASPAMAQVACTDVPTALVSHFVTHNNEYGGHVNAHVLGQTPPPGFTQAARTLFGNVNDYESAWTALRQQQPPVYCAQYPQVGNEAARNVGIQLNARQCTAAAGNGTCTASNAVVTHVATFVFRALANGNGVRWILFTAYPHN